MADAARAVDEDFVESALVGLVGFFVTEMPFAKDSGGVACSFEDLGKDGGVESHALAFEDGVGDAVFEGVTPDGSVALVIGHDEDDVGLFGGDENTG